jgi:hypothetical protein
MLKLLGLRSVAQYTGPYGKGKYAKWILKNSFSLQSEASYKENFDVHCI